MKFLTWSTVAAVVAAGMVASTATPAAAIVGGHDATRTYPGMAAVSIFFPGEGTALCGGIIVSPRYLLTAAHCESDDTVIPTPVAMPGANTTVRIGSNDRTTGGFTATGTTVHLNPHWQWAADPTQPVGDLALVELDRPVPTQLMPISWRTTRTGDPLRLIGWGLTQFPPQPATTAPTRLQQNDTTHLHTTDCAGGFIGAGEICVGGGACYGDSGSPALRQHRATAGKPERWQAVAIASRETDEQSCGMTVYTDLTDNLNQKWIIDTVLGLPTTQSRHPSTRWGALDPAAQKRADALKVKIFQ